MSKGAYSVTDAPPKLKDNPIKTHPTRLYPELKPSMPSAKLKLFEEGFKKCKACEVVKPINDFNLQSPNKSDVKRRPECKECRKARNKAYYQRKKVLKNKKD